MTMQMGRYSSSARGDVALPQATKGGRFSGLVQALLGKHHKQAAFAQHMPQRFLSAAQPGLSTTSE